MGNGLARSPLRALAHYIVNAESTKRERDYIVNYVLGRRYGVNEAHVDPVQGVLRYLAEAPYVFEGLVHLVDSRRTWASLANEMVDDPSYAFCDLDADLNTAIERVIQALAERERLQIRWPKMAEEYLDTSKVQARLSKIEDDWAEVQQCTDPEKLKHLGSVAWDYLGDLLKHAIRFYSEFFGYGDATDITKAFAHARRQESLNPLLEAIVGIENRLRPKQVKLPDAEAESDTEIRVAEEKASKERDLCMWSFGRNSPFEGLLDADVQIQLADANPEWLLCLQKFHKGLELVEQTASVQTKTLYLYQADVAYYRNFYGHDPEPRIVTAGLARARESFRRAQRIVNRLAELHISPTLIIPIEDGVDGYGRRVVRFVRDQDRKETGMYPRDRIRYMFPREDEVIELHEFYFCVSPANNGLFEPVLYRASKIISGG